MQNILIIGGGRRSARGALEGHKAGAGNVQPYTDTNLQKRPNTFPTVMLITPYPAPSTEIEDQMLLIISDTLKPSRSLYSSVHFVCSFLFLIFFFITVVFLASRSKLPTSEILITTAANGHALLLAHSLIRLSDAASTPLFILIYQKTAQFVSACGALDVLMDRDTSNCSRGNAHR